MANDSAEKSVMNQVKTAAGKNAPPSNSRPNLHQNFTPRDAATSADAPPGNIDPNRAFMEAEAPIAPSVAHPNVDAAGTGSPVSYPPAEVITPAPGPPSGYPIPPTQQTATTTKNILPHGPVNQTSPPVNPAPGHPQKTYTQEEMEALLAQQRSLDKVPSAEPNLPTPIRSDERFVTVKPNRTIHPYIGMETWYLEKDRPVRVPIAVAQELARAGCIYPVFNL